MKKAFFALHLSVIVAGFTGIFGRLITLNEGVLVWWRTLFATIFFYIILSLAKKFKTYPKKDIMSAGAIGAVLCMHWILFYGSIKAANVSVGVVCFSLTGFFTALFEPIIFKNHLRLRELFFGSLAVVGISLIFHFDSRYRLGITLGFASSAIAALATILNKKIIPSFTETHMLFFYEILGGLLFLSLLAPLYINIVQPEQVYPDLKNLIYLILFVVFCTIGLQLLQLYALKTISAFTVNLSYNLEPIYTIILAAIIFKEMSELNASFFIGLALIMLSVVLQMINVLKKRGG